MGIDIKYPPHKSGDGVVDDKGPLVNALSLHLQKYYPSLGGDYPPGDIGNITKTMLKDSYAR